MARDIINKQIWNEFFEILSKYSIGYTTSYSTHDKQKCMEYQDEEVVDKHIQINLTIPNYYDEQ